MSLNRPHAAANQRRTAPSQVDQPAIKMQNGSAVLLERRDVELFIIRAERKPGPARSKPCRSGTIPRHRGSFRVAPQAKSRLIFFRRILHFIRWDGNVRHTKLFAVVHRQRSRQGQQQHCSNPCLPGPNPRGDPRFVMIPQHPVRPCPRRECTVVLGDDLRYRLRTPPALEQ